MEFYFTDRKFNLLGKASTSLPNVISLYDDLETEEIDVGVSCFEGALPLIKGNLAETSKMAEKGNFILFKNEYGEDKYFTIMSTEKNRKQQEFYFYAEDAGLDLLNEVIGPFEADRNYNVAYYVNKATFDSGFEIGINEIGHLTRKLKWEGESTATERLLSIATQFDHAEIKFRFEVNNMLVVEKYIDIYKKRGEDLNITLRLGREIDNIITTESIEDLATALYSTGGTPEGKDEPITLKGYEYDDDRFYLKGDGILRDRKSIRLWSRFLTNDSAPDRAHIVRRFNYDTTSQSELCNRTVSKLKVLSEPQLNFEVDIIKLPDNVRIGDRVTIYDEEDELFLSTRILKLERSRSTRKNTATLGEFLIKEVGIDQKLQELADKIASMKEVDSSFLWIRYADDDKGNGMTASPANKEYFAIKAVLNEPVPSNDPADYEGLWVKIQAKDGIPGKDGKPTYTWIRYADTVSGSGISSNPDGKKFIGFAYNKATPTPSNSPTDYDWFLSKGADGNDGQQGVPGKAGADGKTLYTWMKYADTASGGGMSDSGANKLYIGFAYNKTTAVESTNPADYSWSLIKGENGGQGIQGPSGADGKSTYTWVRYATSITGTGMVATPTAETKFIGIAAGMATPTPSTKPTDYIWSKFVGDNGSDGKDGANGANGKTTYFYIAWADSIDGKTGFTINSTQSGNKGYLGSYSSFAATQSNTPTDYAWVKLAGAFEKDLAQIKADITAVNKVFVQPTAPSPVTANMQWWKTESANSGKIIGYFKWTGTAWQAQEIQQSLLNIVELNAVNINGSVLTGSSFLNYWKKPSNGREGVMRIEEGILRSNYTTTEGGVGFSSFDDSGARIELLDKNGKLLGSASLDNYKVQLSGIDPLTNKNKGAVFGVDGVKLTDSSKSHGEVTLSYENLIAIPDTGLTAASGYAPYTPTGVQQPVARRDGRFITLSGAFKNNSVIPAASAWNGGTMGYLPNWAIPPKNLGFIVQGEQYIRYMMYVTTDGRITWARYGTTGPVQLAVGTQLSITCVYPCIN